MPGCLRTGMPGVAWLEATEGKRETILCRFFIINIKECFYKIKLLMDLERSVPMFSFRAVLLRFGVR